MEKPYTIMRGGKMKTEQMILNEKRINLYWFLPLLEI